MSAMSARVLPVAPRGRYSLAFFIHPSTITLIVHGLIVVGLAARIIMNRPATGVALAWIAVIATLPFVGAAVYLLVGERRIGLHRAERLAALRADFDKLVEAVVREGMTDVDWTKHAPSAVSLGRLGFELIGSPALRGSSLCLHADTEDVLRAIAHDVRNARDSVLMEFYIWSEGGLADDVVAALEEAARRGVSCHVLVDSLGADAWWKKSGQPKRLRDAGVQLRPALRTGLLRTLSSRNDLRLHRKIVVIDGEVAWTGSMNLVDPRFFKQDSGVGQWVDAMVRVRGSTVIPLAVTMIADMQLETGEPLEAMIREAKLGLAAPEGEADVQVVPSGPGETKDGLLQMLLGLIYGAEEEIVLTTPYFVPDEAMLRALRGAAGRGVDVHLVVPARVDSFLVRHASRSYYDELLEVGVHIHAFQGGLLHTKSIVADGRISMFGTVNLDMRSLWLNFEVALFVYDTEFGLDLRELQQAYIDDSKHLAPDAWKRLPVTQRFLDNAVRLVSPLL